MKNYKKALIALSVIAALPLMAATVDETIYVTTFADEDGDNTNACSLREAITAASKNQAYGGCPAGKISNSLTDVIQLEAGEYVLTKPLTPSSQVNIYGKTSTSWDSKDAITGEYPERLPLQTTIKGNNTFSLFDTTRGGATVTLNNIKLTEGRSARGGAIKAGGPFYLNRVEISKSSATEIGGAIYLSGVGSLVSITDSVIQNNTAPKAAVLGMSCSDNLKFTERPLTITNSSIVNNGSSSSTSILEYCGRPSIEINASTIAHNTATTTAASQGSILKFTADSDPDAADPSVLSDSSTLKMTSNTIVNNSAFTTLLYDSVGAKTWQYNIIAYNNGYSCRHLLGGVAPNETAKISIAYNGLIRSATTTGHCDIPYLTDTTTLDLSTVSQNTVMTAIQPADKYTAFMPMYFLKNPSTNKLVNIDDKSVKGCSATDQRNVSRIADNVLLLDQATENRCDVGSTEYVRLAASDMSSTNASQVSMIKGFEDERDFFQDLIDSPDTKAEFLKYYENQKQDYAQKIEDFQESFKYRQVYFDIFANSIPHELQQQDGTRVIQHFDADLYNVTTEARGTGQDIFASENASNLPAVGQNKQLRCEWNAKLRQLVMYRTDGDVTQSGDFEYCTYTISLKSDATVKSTGIAQATFTNIAPIAKDDEYTVKWGTDQRVKLDLLANDSDDGDGKLEHSNYPKDQPKFFVYEDGISAPIKLGKIDSNLTLTAQYTRPCPDESRATCYGGDIYVQPKNNFNKFNYSFTYQVFDADGSISNEATVKLINTATTSDDTRQGSSGGSFGIFAVLGLSALALMRNRRRSDI